MKNIIIPFLILIGFSAMAQSVVTVNPGRTVLVSNLEIDSIGGADTSFKFKMDAGCMAYSIQIIQQDTIETVTTSAYLYGSNDGTGWNQIGDSLILTKDVPTATGQNDWWTGTTFPYVMGKIRVPKYTVSDGEIRIVIYYYK